MILGATSVVAENKSWNKTQFKCPKCNHISSTVILSWEYHISEGTSNQHVSHLELSIIWPPCFLVICLGQTNAQEFFSKKKTKDKQEGEQRMETHEDSSETWLSARGMAVIRVRVWSGQKFTTVLSQNRRICLTEHIYWSHTSLEGRDKNCFKLLCDLR